MWMLTADVGQIVFAECFNEFVLPIMYFLMGETVRLATQVNKISSRIFSLSEKEKKKKKVFTIKYLYLPSCTPQK